MRETIASPKSQASAASLLSALPAMCNAYARSGDLEWHEAKPGVFVKLLLDAAADGQRVMLAKLAPGAYSPPHAHEELEHIYVLDGAFHDGERLLSAGDYCIRAPGVVHTASAEQGALTLVLYTPDPRARSD